MTIADPDYRVIVARQLAAAFERMPPGEVIVRSRPELADALEQAVRGRAGVVVEAAPDTDVGVGVGFVAVSPESGVEIDGTLETMLLYRWPELAVSVLAELGT
jgi:vacuolar-type H+-ATPase subunit E/Vma4